MEIIPALALTAPISADYISSSVYADSEACQVGVLRF